MNQRVVTNVLWNEATGKIKTFFIGGNMLSASYYRALAARMGMFENVEVVYSPNMTQASAEYVSSSINLGGTITDSNKMYLKFLEADSVPRKALIIHESTHAVSDMLRMNMTKAESEMMAYIAQCQYAVASRHPGRLQSESNDSKQQAVLDIAWDIAEAMQKGATPTTADYTKLYNAVCQHPYYAKNPQSKAVYDGI
ncbi:MAG: hypothetical protein ABI954_10440 [Pyrinomonadaceae bacterium]